ncbi:MAG: TolC family protein [Pirellulaceae bacterium]|nr:TolC family protein [Pirellulaceae bacterium]
MANNPTLTEAARRVEALRGKHLQVGLYPNPVVGYIGEEMGNDGRGGQQGFFVGQQIVTAGKLGWNRSVVSREIDAAEHEWAMQRLRVVNDVHSAAHRVIAAQRTVTLCEQLLRIGEEGVKVAEQLFSAQEVSRVDVLQTRIEANSARLQLQKANNSLVAEWRSLATLAGTPDLQPSIVEAPIESQFSPLDWNLSLTQLLAESPERMRASAELERARAAVCQARAGRYPDIDVEAGVRYNLASNDTLATAAVALPLQIYNRNQGNIRQTWAELAAAQQNLRRVELALEDRLAAEYRHYSDARETVARYRDSIVPDADSALQLVREGYRQGEFGYLDLLTAQQTYFRAHLAMVDALRDAQISRIRIDGLLLSGGLTSPCE